MPNKTLSANSDVHSNICDAETIDYEQNNTKIESRTIECTYFSTSEDIRFDNNRERISSALNLSCIDDAGSEHFNLERKFVDCITEIHSLAINAYTQSSMNHEYPDWDFLLDSDLLNLNSGFYGQIWVNYNKKVLVIASAGTKLGSCFNYKNANIKNLFGLKNLLQDIISDIQIMNKDYPYQFTEGMAKFIDYIVENNILDRFSGFDRIFTGHSLGAAISELGKIYSEKYQDHFRESFSVTFENPGTLLLSLKLLKEIIINGPVETINIEQIKHESIVIQGKTNLINTLNEQFGKVYQDEQDREIAELLLDIPYIPNSIKQTIQEIANTRSWHSNEHFREINNIRHIEQWPDGLLYDHIEEIYENTPCSRPIVNAIKSIYQFSLSTFAYFYSGIESAISYTSSLIGLEDSNSIEYDSYTNDAEILTANGISSEFSDNIDCDIF